MREHQCEEPAVVRCSPMDWDRSDQKQAEEAMRGSAERFAGLESLINQMQAVAFRWRVAEGWPFEYMSDSVAQFGHTADDFLSGRVHFRDIAHPEDYPGVESEVEQCLAAGVDFFRQEYRVVTPSGDVLWMADQNRIVRDASGTPTHVEGIALDITERKKTELQLQEQRVLLRDLARELASAEERERRDLAAELHDGLGQVLATCRLKLGMHDSAGADDATRALLQDLRQLTDMAIHRTRTLTSELGSSVLYKSGLKAAVEQLGKNLEEQFGLRVTLDENRKEMALNDELRFVLYRSVRELLYNAVKHAKTDRATVHFRWWDGRFVAVVTDEGIGFDPEVVVGARRAGAFGLFSIKERLASLGGDLAVVSAPGAGTRVAIDCPVPEPRPPGTAEPPGGALRPGAMHDHGHAACG